MRSWCALLSVLAALTSLRPSYAQLGAEPSPFWMSWGLGESSEGFAASGLASYQTGKHSLLSVRTAYDGELPIFVTPPKHVWSTGILLGAVVRRADWLASLSTGIAFLQRVEQGELLDDGCDGPGFCFSLFSEYRAIRSHAVGLPLDVQLFVAPRRFVLGVGLHGYATFSPVGTVRGMALHIHFKRSQ